MTDIKELRKTVDLVEVIEANTGQRAARGNKFRCLFHDDHTPSMVIYPDGKFHCFGCGADGDTFDILMKLWNCDLREAIDRVGDIAPTHTPTMVRKRELIPALDPAIVATLEDRITPDIMAWWRSQGIPARPIYALRIGHTGKRHAFPWFYRGVLTAYKMRRDDTVDPTLEPKYTSMKGSRFTAPYNIDTVLQNPFSTVLIVEDEKSVIAAHANGLIAVAFPANGWKEEWTPLFGSCKRIIIVPDNDAAGLASANKIKGMLRRTEIMVTPVGKDLFDLHTFWRESIGDQDVMRAAMYDWLGVK